MARGLAKEEGYAHGLAPGIALYEQCSRLGIGEITIFCFTQDNTKRPSAQTRSFTRATVEFARDIAARGAALLALGDTGSALFPPELLQYSERQGSGAKVNLLVNYGWQWDLDGLRQGDLRSAAVSRIDLIVRWGGGRRLSGFLPAQSVYADIHVREELWPDFELYHFDEALASFHNQDRTLGG